MARIYLDAWGVKRGPHGIARYCSSLVPALVAAAPRHEFVIVRPPRQTAGDGLVPHDAAAEVELRLPHTDWATMFFRPFLEPAFRRYGRPDLYHSLFHMLPLALRAGGRAPRSVVVTVHDLIAIDMADQVKRSAFQRAWATRFDRFVIPYALMQADHVIAVSEATRQRATEWVPLDRSTAIHSGVDVARFDRAAVALPPGVERFETYIAALGVGRPYKNVACVVRALAIVRQTRPDAGLVLIGGNGGEGELIREIGLEPAVVITPQVGDDVLAAIVGSARLFVVASRAEGFGLPVLEAMAIGTPVAASDLPVLHEVGGDAAAYFDPDSPQQLADIMLRLMNDGAARARMIDRGRDRARSLTWRRTAEQTVDVYERVIADL